MPNPVLKLSGFTFAELFHADGLKRLDETFLTRLNSVSPEIYNDLLAYRQETKDFAPIALSELLLAVAPVLEVFLIELFGIEEAAAIAEIRTTSENPISEFKKYFVLRRAKKLLNQADTAHFP